MFEVFGFTFGHVELLIGVVVLVTAPFIKVIWGAYFGK